MSRTPAKAAPSRAKAATKTSSRAKTTGTTASRAKPVASTASKPRTSVKKTAAVNPTVGTQVNQYDAAGMGRRMRGWNPPNSGPNRAIKGLEKLRSRSRDSVRNDWSGASVIQHWTTNLIGVGITPRMRIGLNAEFKTRGKLIWDDWCKVCDADGMLNFYGLQTLATRAWLEAGECFVRFRSRRADFGMEVPLQIQLLEADMVPMLDVDSYPGLVVGNKIRSGIELDRSGQRVAYWVYKEHPGDGQSGMATADQLVRIPKNQMLHIIEPKRVGQLRGVPDLSPVLARLRNVLDFDDAVLERQKLANLFAAFIRPPQGSGFNEAIDPITGKPIETDDDMNIGLEPGIVHKLLPGEDVAFANPPEAGTTYSEFMRSQNMGTASGGNLPYEIMSGDIKEVSDRTLRIVMNEFRRFAEQRQWQIIIPQMCQPVRERFADMAALVGLISLSEIDSYKRVEWAPHGWAYIHPVQDVQAKKTEVDAGFRSRDSVIAERGDDPEAVDAERLASQERAEKLGIRDASSETSTGSGSQDGDGIAPGEYPRNLIRRVNESISRMEALVALVQQVASEPTKKAHV